MILILLGASSACGAMKSPKAKEKVKLIFSVDQGFGNGIVVNDDQAAIGRIIDAVQPLRKRYDVYLLLNPMVADHEKFNHILDIIAAGHMPFMLDVYTSDGETLGSSTPQNAPFDGAHGITISLDNLRKYKTKFGKLFSGLRFMEVFAQDFTVRAIKTTNPEWALPGMKMPPDAFFQPQKAEVLIRFAKENRMFVQFSDWHWIELAGWDKPQIKNEKELSAILRKYPGVVTVTYANNEPNEDSVKRIGYWRKSVEKFVADGAAGCGLSDQSWLRKNEVNCPVSDIIEWAKSALEQECRMIEFEPAWYFFKLPIGSFGVQEYVTDPTWRDRGYPTHNMSKLVTSLLERMSHL
jgi:hypothetical protein